jgi:hypothetical protein
MHRARELRAGIAAKGGPFGDLIGAVEDGAKIVRAEEGRGAGAQTGEDINDGSGKERPQRDRLGEGCDEEGLASGIP